MFDIINKWVNWVFLMDYVEKIVSFIVNAPVESLMTLVTLSCFLLVGYCLNIINKIVNNGLRGNNE